MQKVAIIILHYKNWQITQNCLDSISKISTNLVTYKIYLVNNSLSPLPKNKNLYTIINPNKNLGFAQGNNLGIEKSKAFFPDYYLFLNNDTIVEKYFLEKLIQNLPENDCIAGPVIEHKVKNKTFYDNGGYINWKKGQARHFNKTTYSKTQSIQKRDFVSGCCMLISKNIINKINGFRNDYFLYLEDVELCLRAKINNFQTYLIPQSKIFHLGSQSSSELNKILYSWRNSLKLTWEYIPLKYKFQSLIFNLFFYPSLFIFWQLKTFKQKILKPSKI